LEIGCPDARAAYQDQRCRLAQFEKSPSPNLRKNACALNASREGRKVGDECKDPAGEAAQKELASHPSLVSLAIEGPFVLGMQELDRRRRMNLCEKSSL
jgi:hypothetical protein